MRIAYLSVMLAAMAGAAFFQTAAGQPASPQAATQQSTTSNAAQQSGAPKAAAPKAATQTGAKPAAPGMTNRDVIQLVQAKISDDVIITKIRQSKTRFDTSTQGLVALKQAGVSDQLISMMMNAGGAAANTGAAPDSATNVAAAPNAKARPALRPGETPANAKGEAVATNAAATPRTASEPAPAPITQAPPNYGLYIQSSSQLKPLGRIETKVQVSKFRSFLRSHIPFVRQKIDINLPGAHSSSRYEVRRPTFYAYFPPSRDVSKFKLLQCKITGQNFDQRTLANASIMLAPNKTKMKSRWILGRRACATFTVFLRARICRPVSSDLSRETPEISLPRTSKSSMSTTSV